MTKRRGLEILRGYWGYRRPLTDEVRAECDGLTHPDGLFFALAERTDLPIYQGVRECTRLVDELGQNQLEPGGAAHDWVRRACESMLSGLPEEERKTRLRDEWANGTWSTTEPFVPNDHENEPVPYAPVKFEGGTK